MLHHLLRGIVASRGEYGATIAEMRADFESATSNQWPWSYYSEPTAQFNYINGIFGLSSVIAPSGTIIYYINISPKYPPSMPENVTRAQGQTIDHIETVTKAMGDVHLRMDHWVPQTIATQPESVVWSNGDDENDCQRNGHVVLPNSKSVDIGKGPPKPPRSRIPFGDLPVEPMNGQDVDSQSSGHHSNGFSSTSGTVASSICPARYTYPAVVTSRNGHNGPMERHSSASSTSTGVSMYYSSATENGSYDWGSSQSFEWVCTGKNDVHSRLIFVFSTHAYTERWIAFVQSPQHRQLAACHCRARSRWPFTIGSWWATICFWLWVKSSSAVSSKQIVSTIHADTILYAAI